MVSDQILDNLDGIISASSNTVRNLEAIFPTHILNKYVGLLLFPPHQSYITKIRKILWASNAEKLAHAFSTAIHYRPALKGSLKSLLLIQNTVANTDCTVTD